MWYAYITVLCWSCASFSSSRISRILGAGRANRARLSLALLPLLLWYAIQAPDISWYAGALFLAAGMCHLGMGDLALYGNYRLLGPNFLLLLVCVSQLPWPSC